jgi:hypothetical protein
MMSRARFDGLYAIGESDGNGDPDGKALLTLNTRAERIVVPSGKGLTAPNPLDPAGVGGLNEPTGDELPIDDRGGVFDDWSGERQRAMDHPIVFERDWVAPNPADPADVGGLNEPRGVELPIDDRGGPLDEWSHDWTGDGALLKKATSDISGSKPFRIAAFGAGPTAVGIGVAPLKEATVGSRSKGFGIGLEPLPV